MGFNMSKYSEFKSDELQANMNKNLKNFEPKHTSKLIFWSILGLLSVCVLAVLNELTRPLKQGDENLVWMWMAAIWMLCAVSFLLETYLNKFKELNSDECERAYDLVSNVKECEEYRNAIVKTPRTVRYMDLILMEEMAGFYKHNGNEEAYDQAHSKEDLYVKG